MVLIKKGEDYRVVQSKLAQLLRQRRLLLEERQNLCCPPEELIARLGEIDAAIAREEERGARVYLDLIDRRRQSVG